MDVLSMGGYGVYVWTAYAVTFGVIAVCAIQARQRHRRILKNLKGRRNAVESSE
ncbi:MAG: heme exporter protein CcmD [Woeseiaceae bacterium]